MIILCIIDKGLNNMILSKTKKWIEQDNVALRFCMTKIALFAYDVYFLATQRAANSSTDMSTESPCRMRFALRIFRQTVPLS